MTSIVFFGTNKFAIKILQTLLKEESIDILAVVSKPDSPQGRGKKIQKPPIAEHIPKDVPLLQPEKLNKDFNAKLKELNADLFAVVEYGKIIPEELLNIPKLKTWNIHPSLLPKYRGPSPIESAILNGDKITGTTIMELDSEMDHGPILMQESIEIKDEDNRDTLGEKLAELSGKLLIKTINNVQNDDLVPTEQDHKLATFTEKYKNVDFNLDFNETAGFNIRKIKAFPGEAWFILPNGKRCKIFSSEIVNNFPDNLSKGELYCEKNGCVVKCSDQAITLLEVQVEGKKKIDGKAFANGQINQK